MGGPGDRRSAAAAALLVSAGEVPERLNGRDWKSRNGGNLVRGFESLPLRSGRSRAPPRRTRARDRTRRLGIGEPGAPTVCAPAFVISELSRGRSSSTVAP